MPGAMRVVLLSWFIAFGVVLLAEAVPGKAPATPLTLTKNTRFTGSTPA